MISFIKGRVKSLQFVFKGMGYLMKTEHSIISQSIIFVVFIFMGFYFNISMTQWMFQLFVFGLIFITESLNTAIEEVCNFVHPDYHKKIGLIKDISAGAVGFAALFGLIIAIIIYAQPLINWLKH